jgi:glycerol-3-phosphate acyltransferase PlsX
MYRAIVDGAGSEKHPFPEIEGCIKALKEKENLEIFLIIHKNDKDKIPKKLPEKIEIVEAEEKVGFDEKPTHALTFKKNSTISIGMQMLSQEKGDFLISAGNTGAVVAFSLKHLKKIEGVKRPAICAIFPSLKGFVAVLDVGANVDSKPIYLFQFGIMGYFFAKHILNKEEPKVALLSIGEEEIKGNETVLKAKEIFIENKFPGFIGFVEGKDICKGTADVVVTDGFVGNSILKFGEGLLEAAASVFMEEVRKSIVNKIGIFILKRSIKKLLKKFHYESYGGAPLLGINKTVIICHGRSSANAIKNAIFAGIKFKEEELNKKIEENLLKFSHLF